MPLRGDLEVTVLYVAAGFDDAAHAVCVELVAEFPECVAG